MNKLEQAARQALEALEKYADWRCTPETDQTITALREALTEQAEQAPVQVGFLIDGIVHLDDDYKTGVWPLYAVPVRTKDLTDNEIYKLADDVDWAAGAYLGFARAVIAADRAKNNLFEQTK